MQQVHQIRAEIFIY